MLIPNDKVNDGAYLATSFRPPYGTWANPDNPYCSNTLAWVFLIPCFTGLVRAMSQAFASRGFLEESLAGYPPTANGTQGGGPNHYGQAFSGWSNFEISACGISAGYVKDGVDTDAAIWNPEGDMGDVEAWELLEPLLYLGRRLRPSSAGMGKYRGGSGFESVRMIHGVPYQELFNSGNGYCFHGGGLFGGYPGATLHRHVMTKTDMQERIARQLSYPVNNFDPEDSQVIANCAGDVVRDQHLMHIPDTYYEYDVYLSVLAGGHGCGDILERDPEKVVDDLNGQVLLPRFAASAYGVVAHQNEEGNWRADQETTQTRREEIRRQRLERSLPVSEWLKQQRQRVEKLDFIQPVKEMYRESMTLSPSWAASFKAFWDLPEDWSPEGEKSATPAGEPGGGDH